jgi:aminopeptidase N
MHWEINPAVRYIKGEITYYFKSKVSNLDEFHLDLSNELQVITITRNNQSLGFTHSSDQLLTITLGKNLQAGDHDTLTIQYEGEPPSNGFGSFEQDTHDGQPIIWTLSEPYGVRDWWPSKQDLADKIDSVDIFITTPVGQLAASNGKLMSIAEQNDKLIHHWKHRYPIASYLVALAVTNYEAYSHFLPIEGGESIEILNYVYPESLEQSQMATESSLDIMALFNELFGTYPFAGEKYGHAQFGWGGGMEHQTMSFMGGFSFSLQAHEMAHQWFGDKVTCGSWAEIWLNEGFATYLTGLTYERFSPEQFWPQWKTSTSNSATSQPGGSVFVDDTTSVNRIFSGRLTYNKGSYLLHMLRWITGDNAFFTACRDYLDSPGTAYDFATTEELQAYLELHSGKDLDEFLADWYYGQGFPSYQVRWNQQGYSLVIWLGQTQSHPSVSFFEMPVPVVIYTNGIPDTLVMDHLFQDQRFSFYIGDSQVDSIDFDPALWILSRNNTVTQIVTAVDPLESTDPFILYPNPASDQFHILPSDKVEFVTLTNSTGQRSTLKQENGMIDIRQYAPGFYTTSLYDKEGLLLAIKPIVIQR